MQNLLYGPDLSQGRYGHGQNSLETVETSARKVESRVQESEEAETERNRRAFEQQSLATAVRIKLGVCALLLHHAGISAESCLKSMIKIVLLKY